MKKNDHIRITETVVMHYSAEVAPVPPTVLEELRQGSIQPDRERAYSGLAHHHSREVGIVRLIFRAREAFLNGDDKSSAECLGLAFHFISDGTCPGSTKHPDYSQQPRRRVSYIGPVNRAKQRHNEWEYKVSTLPVPQLRKESDRINIATPKQLDGILFSKKSINPRASIIDSIEMCYAVLVLTWRPLNKITDIEKQLIEETKNQSPSQLFLIGFVFLEVIGFAIPVVLAVMLHTGWFLLGIIAWIWLHYKFADPVWERISKLRSILKWYRSG
jgi:hypothetical protein